MLTDHKNFLYFTTSRHLSRHQARWLLFLADFDFKIVYHPGKEGGKPDSLIHHADFVSKVGDDVVQQQTRALLPAELFCATSVSTDNSLLFCVTLLESSVWLADVSSSITDNEDENEFDDLDIFALDESPDDNQAVLDKIRVSQSTDTFVINSHKNLQPFMSIVDDILLVHERIYVPSSCYLDILRLCHDSLITGHPGNAKTFYLVCHSFWWPQMHRSINSYVASCDVQSLVDRSLLVC